MLKSLLLVAAGAVRLTDLIGRYSGEEFGVILPETDSAAALRIIQGIASRFAAIRYQHDGRNFTCSFSAGIACSQFFPGRAVDQCRGKALYQAKVREAAIVF